MEKPPSYFDWVSARTACSLPAMFLALKDLVDRDVRAMEGKRDVLFELKPGRDDSFLVVKTWNAGGIQCAEGVTFQLIPHEGRISVKDSRGGEEAFTMVPQLETDGSCRFRIKGEEQSLELWQVSRRALEKFFFG
jgi:hypothetical protein